MKIAKITALIATAGMSLGLASSAAAQSYYSALDLGAVYARALNASGQVAGYFYQNNGTTGFYTGANGLGMTTIATPADGLNLAPFTIADNGQVGGGYSIQGTQSEGGGSEGRGFITGPQGQGFTSVSSPDGLAFSWITAINNQGKMTVDTTSGTYLVNTDGSEAKAIDSLGSSMTSYALNASGQVAGASGFSDEAVAFMTGPHGSPIKALSNGAFSEARGINASGQVVGFAANASYQVHAFYTGAQGANLIQLGSFGGQSSAAYGINDLGQAVGLAELADGSSHAFVTDFNGQVLFDLNSLILNLPGGVVLTRAFAINNAGQILASDALGHSYLLTTAIPEVQTSAMMLLGLGAIAWIGKRKKQGFQSQL